MTAEANRTGDATATGSGTNVSVSGVVTGNLSVTSVAGQDAVLLNERVIARELATAADPVKVAERLSGLPARIAANVMARLVPDRAVAAVPSLHETTLDAVLALLAERDLAALLRAAATAADAIDKCHLRHAARLGAERSDLMIAPPNTARLDNGPGFVQEYEHGAVYWTRVTGPQPVWHGIEAHFDAGGGPAGRLGYPVTAEIEIDDTAVMQRFQGEQQYSEDVDFGATVYWSEETGAHSTWGGVGAHHERLGGAGGDLGLPTAPETPFVSARGTEGWRQRFEGGVVYWSGRTGGAVVDAEEVDRFGFPVSEAEDAAPSPYGSTGKLQRYEGDWDYPPDALLRWPAPGGVTLYFAYAPAEGDDPPDYPLVPVDLAPAGNDGWRASDASAPPEEEDDEDFDDSFAAADVYLVVSGGIGVLHEREGGSGGWLGFPLSDEFDVASGRCQEFEGGAAFWTPQHAEAIAVPHPVEPVDLVEAYGFPVTAEQPTADGAARVQFFERGVRTVRGGVTEFWTRSA